MTSTAKKQQKRVGITSQPDLFPDMPRVVYPVRFPDSEVRKRVIIERPAPPPIRRVCITCGASFDDYTCRPDTAYCRAWCKTKMSHIKRDTAVQQFAESTGITIDESWLEYDTAGGLPALEKRLNALGYRFERERKGWVK